MSKQKEAVLPSGYTEEDIEEMAIEAYENGTMEMVEILGNSEPFSKKEDIVHEMLTGDEKDLPVDQILSIVKHLQGKVLTIVDASYDDKERAKFVKDLVKEAFSSSSSWIYEMSFRELGNL